MGLCKVITTIAWLLEYTISSVATTFGSEKGGGKLAHPTIPGFAIATGAGASVLGVYLAVTGIRKIFRGTLYMALAILLAGGGVSLLVVAYGSGSSVTELVTSVVAAVSESFSGSEFGSEEFHRVTTTTGTSAHRAFGMECN